MQRVFLKVSSNFQNVQYQQNIAHHTHLSHFFPLFIHLLHLEFINNLLQTPNLSMIGSSSKPHLGFPSEKNIQTQAIIDTQESTERIEGLGLTGDEGSESYRLLTPLFMSKPGITQIQRYLLKSWVLQEMDKFKFLRQTYCFTSKYIDLFLMKQNQKFPIGSFQSLGIACWIISAKICGERIPPINFAHYNQTEIWQFEKQICNILNFQLHPLTYHCLASTLTSLWDIFTQNHKFEKANKFWEPNPPSVQLYRSFLEIIDGLDLLAISYEFKVEDLVLNTFFLFNSTTEANNTTITMPYIENLLASNHQYFETFSTFKQFLNIKCLAFRNSKISKNTLAFVAPFLNKSERNKPLTEWETKHISIIRHLQSHNKGILKLARTMIKNLQLNQ